MSFWSYMLHCGDRTFYVGHTDDLDRRIAQHESGAIPGYTHDRLPVKLVWCQEFGTREEARSAEAKLKGWGKPKKLALIRGDWELISTLAKGKGRASTSSAKSDVEGAFPKTDLAKLGPDFERSLPTADLAEPVEALPSSFFLHPHHQTLPTQPFSLEVTVRRTAHDLHLRYRLTGRIEDLAIPERTPSIRADNLWQTTCLEAFIQPLGGTAYREFNFAPSTGWAAYAFAARREGMTDLPVEPAITIDQRRFELTLAATVPDLHPAPLRLGLSAVIEELNGTKSWWALSHPDPEKPDFHDPAGFTLELPRG